MKKIEKYIIAVIGLIAIGAIGTTIYFGVNKDDNTNNNVNEVEKGLNNTIEVESVIKDKNVIAQLSEKVNWLNMNVHDSSKIIIDQNSLKIRYEMFNSKLYQKDLTEEEKIIVSISSLGDFMLEVQVDENNNDFLKKNVLSEELKNVKVIDFDLVNNRHKELFGSEIILSENEVGSCPKYKYNLNDNMYYYIPGCGWGGSSEQVLLYKNKYTQKGDEAYVYVSVGHIDIGSQEDEVGYNVYSDHFFANDYKLVEYINEINGENYQIDKNNYRSFKEYKFIFSKEIDGQYKFVRVE